MSAAFPSKKSGMKTWYGRSLSVCARMSAPWSVWLKKPKMSYTTRIPCFASLGPVASGINGQGYGREWNGYVQVFSPST